MRSGVPGEKPRASARHPDRRDDRLDFLGLGGGANDVFHPFDDPFCLFDPCADGRSHLNEELALVGLGEEFGPTSGRTTKAEASMTRRPPMSARRWSRAQRS